MQLESLYLARAEILSQARHEKGDLVEIKQGRIGI